MPYSGNFPCLTDTAQKIKFSINPFVPNALFLYLLKTSENLKVFRCFQGVEKECIGNEWVKQAWTNWERNLSTLLKYFFSICDHIWSHLLKKFLMENFIFCTVWSSAVWSLRKVHSSELIMLRIVNFFYSV